MATLLLHLVLTRILLNISLHTAMLPRLGTPRVRFHPRMVILATVLDKDIHLLPLNLTVYRFRNLYDHLTPSSNHSLSLSRSRNLSRNLRPNPSLSRSRSFNPNLNRSSSSIIPWQLKLHRLLNLRGRVNPGQNSPAHRTCMTPTSRTQIRTFKRGRNTTPREVKTPLELCISSRFQG